MSLRVGLSTLVTIECLLYARQSPSAPSDNIGQTKSQVIKMSQLTYSDSPHFLCTSKSCKRDYGYGSAPSAGGCVGVKPRIPPPTSLHLRTNTIPSK